MTETLGAKLGDRARNQAGESVIGRGPELLRLDRFVRDARPGSSIVLIGAPGIGKTTLWDSAVDSAREAGRCVLAARPTGGAAQLPFGGLIDLCDPLGEAELAILPGPQRRALEAALMRTEPEADPAPTSVVALALLGVVRALSAHARVVIAIDDVHWLDQPAAEAVAFLARRLDGAHVTFLLARRPGHVGVLEGVVSRAGVERLRVGALSFGATRRLLFERLGLTISRQRLRQIVDATGGNPLFALEMGRALLDGEGRALEEGLPLPDSVEEMLSDRVARLPPAVRRVLLAVALSEDTRLDRLLAIVDRGALDDAVDAEAVAIDGQHVRPAHPLLAAAAEKRAPARMRREVHLALSEIATEEPARALHMALARSGPDGALALRVAAAAELARARGERREAALLATHALRLTPGDAAERAERVLELAERLDDAGELRQMTVLLRDELPSLPG
ncbi:MAG TPA: ATP-binding protein, partial [Solirubrobacteraceae bacterium]|nr:ATP-binding protein [Solirubrobacteraceae bacterium]